MKKSTRKEIPVLEQWIEVTIDAKGITRTALFPSNAVLLAEAEAASPRPELVYRRFHFPAGVPKEYLWTVPPDEQTRVYGGGGLQRMTLPAWLDTIAAEQFRIDGHVGPSRHPSVPRPKERGGCDCDVCQSNEYMLHELGYEV